MKKAISIKARQLSPGEAPSSATAAPKGPTLYVNQGSTVQPATGSKAAPFITIQDAVNHVTQANSTIEIFAGTYRESVSIKKKKVLEGLTLRAYEGQEVVISGLRDITSADWSTHTNHAGVSMLKATIEDLALQVNDLTFTQVFIGGQHQPMARYPKFNSHYPGPHDYLNCEGGNGWATNVEIRNTGSSGKKVGQITFPEADHEAIAALGSLEGAIFQGITGNMWCPPQAIVATKNAVDNGVFLTRANTRNQAWAEESKCCMPQTNDKGCISQSQEPKGIGYGCLLHHPNLISEPGEWYYNSQTGTLILKTESDTAPPEGVEVRQHRYGAVVDGVNRVTFENLSFKAASIKLAKHTSGHCLRRLKIFYPTPYMQYTANVNRVGLLFRAVTRNGISGSDGVVINSDQTEITQCEVAYSWGDGFTVRGSEVKVNESTIYQIGWLPLYHAAIQATNVQEKLTVQHNTLYHAGRYLLQGLPPLSKVLHNTLHHAMQLSADGGAIYSFHKNAQFTEIAHNTIHTSQALKRNNLDEHSRSDTGIYLDLCSSRVSIHHNVIYDISKGIHINLPAASIYVYNNTLDCAMPLMFGGDAPLGVRYFSRFYQCAIVNNLVRQNTNKLYHYLNEHRNRCYGQELKKVEKCELPLRKLQLEDDLFAKYEPEPGDDFSRKENVAFTQAEARQYFVDYEAHNYALNPTIENPWIAVGVPKVTLMVKVVSLHGRSEDPYQPCAFINSEKKRVLTPTIVNCLPGPYFPEKTINIPHTEAKPNLGALPVANL